MSLKFEQFVEARFEYMTCFLAGGMVEGGDKHLSLSKKVLGLVSKQLHFVPSMDCNAARRLLAMTSSSSLLETDRQELMCRLNDKVDLDESTDASSLASASSASQISPQLWPREFVGYYL